MTRRRVQLTALMGLPASGKSSCVQSIIGPTVVCPDAIRKQLSGDMSDMSRNAEVFEIAHNSIRDLLANHVDVIYDATNVRAQDRAAVLKIAKDHDAETRLIIMRTSFEECKARNAERDRVVPAHVMDLMHERFVRSLSEIGYEPWSQIVNKWDG